jgi:glucoamylase
LVIVTLALVGSALAAPVTTAAEPSSGLDAPAAKKGWTEADKAGFGTARNRGSRVWFTLRGGEVSEVFYPDLSTPSVRSLGLTVSDGTTTDDQGTDMATVVSRPDERSLRFVQVSTDLDGRYRLTEEVVTDAHGSALVIHVRLESLDGGSYTLGVDYDPALGNGGDDDLGRSRDHVLYAVDKDDRIASALVASPRLEQGTDATDVDLVQTGVLPTVGGETTISLGFGSTRGAAGTAARAALARPYDEVRGAYDEGWHLYVDSLKRVPTSARAIQRQYWASALVLAAGEDKTHRGAFIASPSVPWVWGDEIKDLSDPSVSYHEVWARDLYQIGTALDAMGDKAAARRAVKWLFETQQKPDGSFPQNSDVDGTEEWTELQLDQVTLPIALAHLVGKTDGPTYRGVRKAVHFLLTFRDEETGLRAPYSPQERWENQSGYSPATIAAEIDGLVTGAAIARRHGDRALARSWERVADRWAAHVKAWTATSTGPLSGSRYFLRVTKDGKPDRGTTYAIGDGGPGHVDQRRVVDPSFLDLVRFGILGPHDRVVRNTIGVVDADLAVDTPNGRFWHRFSFDGYGETRTGGEWRITDDGAGKTLGRAWPLLAGERGEYAVAAGRDGAPYLASMAAAASGSDMIAEQVWDGRAPTGQSCCTAGEGTRSATPLLWSHAGLVRLAWTIERGSPVDQQRVVVRRYR